MENTAPSVLIMIMCFRFILYPLLQDLDDLVKHSPKMSPHQSEAVQVSLATSAKQRVKVTVLLDALS